MNEEERKSIKNLKKYIEEDGVYKKTLKYYSDFDKFCYNHCKDIDTVLILVEKLQKALADEDIKSTEKINKLKNRLKSDIEIGLKELKNEEWYTQKYAVFSNCAEYANEILKILEE